MKSGLHAAMLEHRYPHPYLTPWPEPPHPLERAEAESRENLAAVRYIFGAKSTPLSPP